jgi:type II secretory pathway component GspD/PulD (secretin)
MKTKMTMSATMASLVAVTLLGACERPSRVEVRTFALEHLDPGEAMNLIDPYVYGEREGTPGAVSTTGGALTVRETRENLERIEGVLSEFDRPRPETRLHFQLIEADGFSESDARIAVVEQELRRVFQFRGYRLAGETLVTASDASNLHQELRSADGDYAITVGNMYSTAPGVVRLEEIRLWAPAPDGEGRSQRVALQTTVNIRPGQTLVLGSSPKDGSTATLFLAVRADLGAVSDADEAR